MVTGGNPMTTRVRAQTARGMFLAAAVGDALGWPQEIRGGLVGGQKERDRTSPRPEFRNWTRHAGHYSRRYYDPVAAGEYSDDSQLLLATARSCLEGPRWWNRLTEVELPAWPLYQRGGGGAVLSAAASWADGRPPWRRDGPARAQAAEKRYRGAGANGVAMRIAPHVLWANNDDDVVQRVMRDGIATHGHPRALVGALVYAFALRHAATSREEHGFGDSVEAAAAGLIDVDHVLPALPSDWGTPRELGQFADTWQETTKETSQLLTFVMDSLQRGAMSNPEATLEQLGCTDPKINGAGTVSAAAAIYLASRFAARPQNGLLTAAYLHKADTDTLASLTAAILGTLHGTEWLGNLADEVQDADYIARVAEHTAAHATNSPPWPTRPPRTLRRTLSDTLRSGRDTHGEFPDGRHYRLNNISALHDNRTMRAWLRLDDGQTAIVDLRSDPARVSSRTGHVGGDGHSRKSQPRSRRHGDQHEADMTSDATATPAHRSSRETGVILATRNLARSAAFYAQLTGRDIPVRAGIAEITPALRLRQSASDAPIDTSSATVHIHVEDLSAAARRLGFTTTIRKDNIELRDPDGRTVIVNKHSRQV
jgi:ADP-ribosylglycohydrolase